MKRFDLAIKFQYNSCYCLSINVTSSYSTNFHFNTTLVTVYQRSHLLLFCPFSKFQYNSCYCLSLFTDKVDISGSLFQYNSCYCLSNAFKPFFHFIIASFPDKINVSLNFSQPSSIFSHFSPIHLQTAISRGLYAIINFIGWEISIPYRSECATRRV